MPRPDLEPRGSASNRGRAGAILVAVGLAVLGFLGATVIYWGLTTLDSEGQWRSDVLWHNQLLIESRSGEQSLGYTIYYWLLEGLAGGNLDPDHLRTVAVMLLSFLMAAKLVLTFGAVHHLTRKVWWSAVAAVAVVVMMPPDLDGQPGLYMGKFTGTIWHNSTTVLLMPLSIIVFFLVLRYLSETRAPRWLPVTVVAAVALNAAAKPNYMLVVLPAAGILCLWLVGRAPAGERAAAFWRLLRRYLLIVVSAAVVLVPVYLGVQGSGGGVEGSSMGVRPMAVWHLLTPRPALALVESFALPALIAAFLGRLALKSKTLVFAWLGAVVGVTEFIVMAEIRPDGTTLQHGNWIWGAHAAALLLSIASVIAVLRHWSALRLWQRVVLGALALVQFATGIVYLTQLHSGPSSYS